MTFNPFDVLPGEQLAPEELQKLITRSVAEGYFVEYKSMPPDNVKMGRSVASLANTYGGWYIVGVTTDGHNIANAISGFDPALCPDPIARIREVIKTHISPSPVFFAQVVTLDSGNLVLVVHVPDGQDCPFITRDGRIYRRRHDSSDPMPEADRHAFDRLVEQGRESQEEFARFCRDERNVSQAEDKRRWVGIYIQPYPRGIVDRRHKMRSLVALDEAMALSKSARTLHVMDLPDDDIQDGEVSTGAEPAGRDSGEAQRSFTVSATGNIPFTSGMLTPRSIILRQVERLRVGINSTISVELFFDGSAKIFFELPEINPLSHTKDVSGVSHERVRETLLQFLHDDAGIYGVTLVRFVDIAGLWATIGLLVTYYQAWLGDEPMLHDVKVAISLSGVWRSAPFLDADEWAEYVQKYGLPVLHQDNIWVPPNVRKADTYPLTDRLWLAICGLLQLAIGFPYELMGAAILQILERQLGHEQKS